MTEMRYRELGSTRKQVSRIGLGMAALGRPGYINLGHAEDLARHYDVDAMRSRAAEMLQRAYDAGVRYFDAARSYGKAEQFLGNWLRDMPEQNDLVIGSKWGYEYTADWQVDAEVHEEKQHSLERLNQQWKETKSHLGTWLDLYQIHSATLKSGVLENREVLDRLTELKAGGIAIGLSVSGTGQAETIQKALEIEADDQLLFDTVQATWNLLEQSTGTVLHEAHEAGLGIIIKEALANGRLTDRNQDADFQQRREVLQKIADQYETSLDAVAIAFVLRQPWADIVLSGAATPAHLQSNLSALDIEMDDHTAAELDHLTETPEEYWNKRSNLSWN